MYSSSLRLTRRATQHSDPEQNTFSGFLCMDPASQGFLLKATTTTVFICCSGSRRRRPEELALAVHEAATQRPLPLVHLRAVLALCIWFLAAAFSRAEIGIGDTRDEVLRQLGKPSSRAIRGDHEILLYPKGGRVE